MELLKGYQDNTVLRNSFFKLANRIFQLNLSEWHDFGFWSNDYIPYSIIENNEVISNASANIMSFFLKDKQKKFIQIGTVMTKEEYRNQGYASCLIKSIIDDYPDADGFYLFANAGAVNFYPRLGFRCLQEFIYSTDVSTHGNHLVKTPKKIKQKDEPIFQNAKIIDCRSEIKFIQSIAEHRSTVSSFQMQGNTGLTMFHLLSASRLEYLEPLNAVIAAELSGDTLAIFDIYSPRPIRTEDFIDYLPPNVKSIDFGYTPFSFTTRREKVDAEDRLYVQGKGFDAIDNNKLCFPLFSHA